MADPKHLAKALGQPRMEHVTNAVRNASEVIKHNQGGISTVHIGDIVDMLKHSGLTKEHVHEAIAREAREGRASLAQSSQTDRQLTPSRHAGALKIEGEPPFHMVTFK